MTTVTETVQQPVDPYALFNELKQQNTSYRRDERVLSHTQGRHPDDGIDRIVILSQYNLFLFKIGPGVADVVQFRDPKRLKLAALETDGHSVLEIEGEGPPMRVSYLPPGAAQRMIEVVDLYRHNDIDIDGTPGTIVIDNVHPIYVYEAMHGPNKCVTVASTTRGNHTFNVDYVASEGYSRFMVRHIFTDDQGQEHEVDLRVPPFTTNNKVLMRDNQPPYEIRIIASPVQVHDFLEKQKLDFHPDEPLSRRYTRTEPANALREIQNVLYTAGLKEGMEDDDFRILRGDRYDYLEVFGNQWTFDSKGRMVQVTPIHE